MREELAVALIVGVVVIVLAAGVGWFIARCFGAL